MMIDEILNIKHLRKSFYHGRVLDDINLNVIKGEILGLIGENGSGKSVLIKIIAGELKKDQGEMFFEDLFYEPEDIIEAQKCGVYRISQKNMLLDNMSVAENLICVQMFSGLRFMTNRQINKLAQTHLNEFGMDIFPGTYVKNLSLVQKKQVEFLKIILKKPKLLIMDGVFSVLDEKYRLWFMEQIQMAQQNGTTILIVSQNLELVIDICDRIAIMQDAQIVQVVAGSEAYLSSLFAALRRNDTLIQQEKQLMTGKKVLTIDGVCLKNNVEASFSLYEKEVLGIYSNDTLATDELISVLCGQETLMQGNIAAYGKRIDKFSLEVLAEKKICVISGEKANQMLLYEDTVMDNIAFCSMQKALHYGFRNSKMEKLAAVELAEECGFTKEELHMEVKKLSVCSRQKLSFANSIALGTQIYILDNIMSHVDYQSQKILYQKIIELKKKGASFLFIAKEFEELRIISDRIIYTLDKRISDRWFY